MTNLACSLETADTSSQQATQAACTLSTTMGHCDRRMYTLYYKLYHQGTKLSIAWLSPRTYLSYLGTNFDTASPTATLLFSTIGLVSMSDEQ
jgi:hypothetical protein